MKEVSHWKETIISMTRQFSCQFKKLWNKFNFGNASTHEIAAGLAIGVFVGFTPLVGIQTLLILILVLIIPFANKIAAYLSSWVMNQFTIVPIYLMDYWIGTFFYSPKKNFQYSEIKQMIIKLNVSWFLDFGKDIYVPMLIGGIISGLISAFLTYCLSHYIIQKRRNTKDLRNMLQH